MRNLVLENIAKLNQQEGTTHIKFASCKETHFLLKYAKLKVMSTINNFVLIDPYIEIKPLDELKE